MSQKVKKKKTNGYNCAVFGCGNAYEKTKGMEPKVHYFSFPPTKRVVDVERRRIWIRFVGRKNADGTDWEPTKHSRICSVHFIGNEVASRFQRDHPAYHPTIHPIKTKSKRVSETSADRYDRLQDRNKRKATQGEVQEAPFHNAKKNATFKATFKDCAAQTDISMVVDDPEELTVVRKEWICFSHAHGTNSHLKNLETQVNHVYVRHASSGPDPSSPPPKRVIVENLFPKEKKNSFCYESLKDNELEILTSVHPTAFGLLLKLLKPSFHPRAHSVEDMLLAFLMKLKSGLPFGVISIFISIKESTLTDNFRTILDTLYDKTQQAIPWPTKEFIQAHTPDCFKENFPNMRCIINCIEFPTEKPQVSKSWNSSHKETPTFKFLVANAPDGLFSFVSQAYDGSASDTFITRDCGLLEKLKEGDIALANKGFPTLKSDAVIKMIPQRGKSDRQYSEEEWDKSKRIAKERMRIQSVIQRLKGFKILSDSLPRSLFPSIHKLVHVCAILVNMHLNTKPSRTEPQNEVEPKEVIEVSDEE